MRTLALLIALVAGQAPAPGDLRTVGPLSPANLVGTGFDFTVVPSPTGVGAVPMYRDTSGFPVELRRNLEGLWRGYGVQGASWLDESGHGRHLALTGNAGEVPERRERVWEFGNGAALAGLKFNGTGSGAQSAQAARSADWTFLTQASGSTFAISFVNYQAGGGVMLSTFGNSWGNGSGILLGHTAGAMYLYVGNGLGSALAFYIAGAAIAYDVRHTIVWRFIPNGGAGTLNVRVDGVQVNNSATTNTYGTIAAPSPLHFGGYSAPTAAAGSEWAGVLGEASTWSRPLSDAEVASWEAWANRAGTPAAWPASDSTKILPKLVSSDGGAPTVTWAMISDSTGEGKTCLPTNLSGGARHQLWTLADSGVPIQLDELGPYVGTLVAPSYPDDQTFAKGGATIWGHSGSSPGAATGSVPCNAAPGGCLDALIGTGKTYHPQIFVILIGRNNVGNGAVNNNPDDWATKLVLDIHAREPAARFVLSSIGPTQFDSLSNYAHFNQALASTLPWLRAQGVQFVTCDAYNAITDVATMTCDGLHWNDDGGVAVGNALWPCIQAAAGYP
jgi:hypothetical protein